MMPIFFNLNLEYGIVKVFVNLKKKMLQIYFLKLNDFQLVITPLPPITTTSNSILNKINSKEYLIDKFKHYTINNMQIKIIKHFLC
jgi:hypothetical protein